jgi:hypothetical protein
VDRALVGTQNVQSLAKPGLKKAQYPNISLLSGGTGKPVDSPARNIIVNRYSDRARGILEINAEGKLAITRVELKPEIKFENKSPQAEMLEAIHHMSHEQ